MTMPAEPPAQVAPKKTSLARRLAAVLLVGVILFALLWYTVFTAVSAALVSAGVGGVLIVGSTLSDAVEMLLDLLSEFVLGVVAAVVAVFAAIFSIFN